MRLVPRRQYCHFCQQQVEVGLPTSLLHFADILLSQEPPYVPVMRLKQHTSVSVIQNVLVKLKNIWLYRNILIQVNSLILKLLAIKSS